MKNIKVLDLDGNALAIYAFSGDVSGVEALAESMRTPDNNVVVEEI